MTLRIGSLCSGYGGLDLAVEAVFDAHTAWFVEYDRDPSAILAHHWPHVPNHGDVKTTDWSQVEPVDILTAGYPCQPFSYAGKRKGHDDPRHLWPDVARAIGALRPGLVVLENVRGHVSLGLDAVIGDLSALGYDARWGVVRAADAGAPHGRARIFIVASPVTVSQRHNGRGTAGATGRSWGRWRDALRPADASADTVGERWGEGRPDPARRLGGSAPVVSGSAPADASRERHGRGQDGRGLGRVDGTDAGTPRERERARGVAVDRGVATPADADDTGCGEYGWAVTVGAEHSPAQRPVRWGAYEPAIRRWEAVIGRPAPDPTEPGRNGRPRLAPAFVEWMMGLDAGHVTDVPGLSRNAQLKALGNGVVPQQAALALRLLLGMPTTAPGGATTATLLPTPLASDGEKGGPNQRGGSGDLRLSSAVHLMGEAHV